MVSVKHTSYDSCKKLLVFHFVELLLLVFHFVELLLLVFHFVELLFLLIISAFQDLICSTFWIAIAMMIRVCGEDL